MFEQTSSVYGLRHQARCIVPQTGRADCHRFVLGSLNPRKPAENELHVIEFDDDANQVKNKGIFAHEGEVWDISTSPSQHNLLFTSYRKEGSFQTSLWRMRGNAEFDDDDLQVDYGDDLDLNMDADAPVTAPVPLPQAEGTDPLEGADEDTGDLKLEHVLTVPNRGGARPSKVLWHNLEGCYEDVLVADGQGLRSFKVDPESGRGLTTDDAAFSVDVENIKCCCWDPHHRAQLVTGVGRSLVAWDTRDGKATVSIKDAHEGPIQTVDFNPNKPYHVVSGGQDCKIRLWDLRKADEALMTLGNHSHWVWSAKYNPFHDQLILSAGGSGIVNLWSIVSVSSAPLGDLEDPQNQREGDKLIKSYEEHEDSVYNIAWSCYDAWVFASLSYDGRVVVNHVPPTEKYKILL
jgi:WD40 repeat protein